MKKIVNLGAGVLVLSFVFLTGTLQPVQAQAVKVGDHVDVQMFSQWLPCTVKDTVLYSGKVGAYLVTCTVIASNGPQDFTVALADVRPRVATAEDKKVEAETAAALARQPKGNSIGAKYGTREPRPCGSRTAPAHGAPSAEQAKQYVICELEKGNGLTPLFLVTNVKVQVASVSHAANAVTTNITAADIDPREPVWDIRGSFTLYECFALSTLTASNDFARTHNCWVTDTPTAGGYCYKNTFGDWHCGMIGGAVETKHNVLPPEGY